MNPKFRNFLKHIYLFIQNLWRLNWGATLYANFRLLPLSHAIKFPMHLYGKIRFKGLSGSIIIKAPVKCGIIKIGYRWFDLWNTSYLPTQLGVTGTITFNGPSIISGGAVLNAFNKRAHISLGINTLLGRGAR